MIDVKLVSSASAPAQKAVDAWLQSWRLGQRFSGQVLSQSGTGEAVIRIGAQQITARAPFALPTGAAVRFEVTALLPQPQLKIAPNNPAAAEAASTMERQLRLLLPIQDSVAAPLARLLLGPESAKLLSLLGLGNDAAGSLRALLPTLQQMTDPAQLQALLLNSGAFASVAGGAGNDLRLALLRLLQRIAGLRAGNPGAQGVGSGGEQAARGLLSSLGGELQGALATLALSQLAMAQVQAQAGERAPYMWLFDLPYQWRGRPGSLSLLVQRERRRQREQAGDEEEETGWQVTLRLELPGMGAVEVQIFEQSGRLSVVLRAQRAATRQLFSDHLPALQQALAQRGLEIAVLRCYMGDYSPPAGAGQWDGNVSVSI
ncbi:flagellar hook-length control protein FliK [Pseudohalioglobus lutimaris]|nr:flagellar hook-length control protein FliK [Pseudohalioglobus lutimaris]